MYKPEPTIISYNGRTITLTQDADHECNPYYPNRWMAYGIDQDGVQVVVRWEATNPDAERAEDACDWDSPDSVENA